MTDIVVDIPSGAHVIAVGDGVYAAIGNSADNVAITNSGDIRGGDDGVEITALPTIPPLASATGTFSVENSGVILSTATGRAINVDLPLTALATVTITNHATGLLQGALGEAIVISGSSADTIINEGIINGSISTGDGNDIFNLFTGSSVSGEINGGNGIDVINLEGSGAGSLQNFAGIEVINVNEGAWTIDLQSGPQTLRLANAVIADGSFDGAINNLGVGDTVNLAGIGLATSATLGADNLLTISGGAGGPVTVQLDPSQSFVGMAFQLIDDGAGGTSVLLASQSTLDITGNITTPSVGVLITVSPGDPGAGWTVTTSGTIDTGDDSLLVTADPAVVAATGTFIVDNSGTMKSAFGHAINFDLPLTAPGSVTIVNRATGIMEVASGDAIVISGDTNDTITNQGTIIGGVSTGAGNDTLNLEAGSSISGLLNGGLGTDTINLNGAGQGSLQDFSGIEAINVNEGSWTLGSEDAAVNFETGSQTVRLANGVLANGSFSGTISNFATGDLIGLAGIGLATSAVLGANNVLTIAGGSGGPITLQLDPAQDFSGLAFALGSDGAGGTNIALVPATSGGGVVIGGTPGSDAVTSGNGNDIIVSGDGNDTVSAGGGNDFIQAGNGNSVLSGQNGNDTIIAGNGNNTINGGNGDDQVTAGNGNNALATENGNDIVVAGNGINNISSGNGDDRVTVGNGNNTLATDNGNDTVIAGNGNNAINSGNGDDQVIAGNGANLLNTENGNDVITAGDGDNRMNAGNGNDAVTVGDGDNMLNGGNGADIFRVGSGDNTLTGGNGADTFVFAADFGNNVITDFDKNDTIVFEGVFTDFQDLLDATTQIGADTVIALSVDQTVTLLDVSLNKLHAAEFVFA